MAVQAFYLASVGGRFQSNEAANDSLVHCVQHAVSIWELSGSRWTLCLLLAALRLWCIQPVPVSEDRK